MTGDLLPVAILAGGLAKRLEPLTRSLPKALMDVNGEPFIAHQLRLLRSRGADRVVICAGYRGEQIEEFVGDGSRFGLRVTFSFDGPRLLGTAGALRLARDLLGDAFLVLYGDSYLRCDYRAVQTAFAAHGRLGLMTVFRNERQWDRSNVEFRAGALRAYDKAHPTPDMHHIDYGLGALRAAALDQVPHDQPYDLADLYARLLAEGELGAYEVTERFYEIGSPSGLEELRRVLSNPTGTREVVA